MRLLFLILLLLSPILTWAAAPWKVTNPEGTLKMTLYQKAGDSAVVRINYGRADLSIDATMRKGQIEYKEEAQSYYVVVPSYMKQKLIIWRKDEPGNRLELQIPSLEPRRLIEFNISEETVVGSRGEGKGKWSLNTQPSGANYEVDGLPISGITPVPEKEYNVQTYKVLLTKDRYKPTEVLIDVQKDAVTAKTIQLEPNWGDVEFKVNIPSQISISGITYSADEKTPLILAGESKGLTSGKHNYSAQAPGYKTIEDYVVIQAGESRVIPLQLQFAEGNLNFISVPDNSRVSVNGTLWGTTPFTREKVPAGTYQATFEHEGYEPRQATIVVDKFSQDIKVNLALTSGNLTLYAEPGSQVTLNNQVMASGLTQFKNLEIKEYQVKVTHPDYMDWVGQVSIFEENQTLNLVQIPKDATISVAGNIQGAEVSIDGRVIGQSPLNNVTYPASKNSVQLRVYKPGFTVLDTSIYLYANSKASIQFELEDVEERNRREAGYTKYEYASPLEIGVRQAPNGGLQYGFREGSFVYPRGLSLMANTMWLHEFHVQLDKTNDRIDGFDARVNLFEKRYGIQLKTPASFIVAKAGASIMAAPTFHFNTDNESADNLAWKLKESDKYDIYMRRGLSIDLVALQAIAGINIHPAFGNVYAGFGLFGGLVMPSAVSAVLHSGVDSTQLTTEEREEMNSGLSDAIENAQPYLYPSISLGMNFFFKDGWRWMNSAEPYEEWFEALTFSLNWGGTSGDYGFGWDAALGKFSFSNSSPGSSWLLELLPMRWVNHSYGIWLSKGGYAIDRNFLFFNAELSASVGYGWTWDLPKSTATNLYGLSEKQLNDSLAKVSGQYVGSDLDAKVEGTKYGELRLGLYKRFASYFEIFADITTEFGSWEYRSSTYDKALDSQWGFTSPAISVGLKYSSTTQDSED